MLKVLLKGSSALLCSALWKSNNKNRHWSHLHEEERVVGGESDRCVGWAVSPTAQADTEGRFTSHVPDQRGLHPHRGYLILEVLRQETCGIHGNI